MTRIEEQSDPTPQISVVVIAYNEEQRISECLASIFAQETASRYEVVVVDDGSTDRTLDVLRAAHGHDPRLRVVALGTNRGRGAARRAGIDAATGSVIGFVDADIVLPTGWLEQLLPALTTNVAASGIAVPDGDCAVLWRMFSPTARVKQGSESITGNNMLIDAAVLRSVGFPSTRLGEDFRLAGMLRTLGHRSVTVPSVQVEHREAKTYRKALRWLYDSGADASSLLAEFGRVRPADLAWFGWVTATVLTAIAVVFGELHPAFALAVPLVTGSVIAFGHAFSRFAVFPRPFRFAAAALADVPLILGYLLGRSVGAIRVLLRR